MGSCSKRTNPSPCRPAQAEAVEPQPFASHCRRTHGHQDHPGLVPAELQEGDRSYRTKRLLHHLESWDRRIASDEVEHKPVEGSLVGGTEIPAAGGKASLAAKHTVVEGTVRIVVEGRVNPVVVEDKVIPAEVGISVADSQAEWLHSRIRPGVVETVWAY